MTGGATPTISVLIPTYNRASVVGETLESVIRQTTPVHEIILIDDGSTDGTEQIVASVRDRLGWSGRLHYERQENQGKSVALNLALTMAKGEWVAFNDSDDIWLPDKVERQMAALREHPECGACFSSVQYANSKELHGTSFDSARYTYEDMTGVVDDPARLILEAPHGVYMQTVIVRADVMTSVGPFDPRFRVSQDTDFLFRLGLRTRWCYVNAPLVLLDRSDRRAVGLTTEFSRQSNLRQGVLEAMYERWLELVLAERNDLRTEVRGRLQGIRFEQANLQLKTGDVENARRRSLAALRAQWSLRAVARVIAVTLAPRWSVRRSRKE